MVRYKIICPACGAVIHTTTPYALIWEACPGCGSHRWDLSDILMAEAETQERSGGRGVFAHGAN